MTTPGGRQKRLITKCKAGQFKSIKSDIECNVKMTLLRPYFRLFLTLIKTDTRFFEVSKCTTFIERMKRCFPRALISVRPRIVNFVVIGRRDELRYVI